MKRKMFFLSLIVLVVVNCTNRNATVHPDGAEVLHKNIKNLTSLIVYDIFTPPVAARIYSYTSLAAHEAIRYLDENEPSIIEKLNGFSTMPVPDRSKKYDYTLAASVAFYSIARELTFSQDQITRFENETYLPFKAILNSREYNNSVAFGKAIAAVVMERAKKDNYKETRAMEKFQGSEEEGKWRPTNPDYMDGTEPYWSKISSFSLDSSSQFCPGPPPAFNKEKNSLFYKINKEVYDTGMNLTPEQKNIAYFWDDNPFVSNYKGHLAFNTKKQTPGGHWMGITTIACRKTKADVAKTARAYSLVAVGLMDGFISCWDTKYNYKYIRPVTVINSWFDKKWEPYLQTPPFPEYTSGHSTISGSAATILTALFGENFAYHDDADKEYIGMERDFTSFMQAAQEASVSRFYGGIHYMVSLDTGLEMGKRVGEQVLRRCR